MVPLEGEIEVIAVKFLQFSDTVIWLGTGTSMWVTGNLPGTVRDTLLQKCTRYFASQTVWSRALADGQKSLLLIWGPYNWGVTIYTWTIILVMDILHCTSTQYVRGMFFQSCFIAVLEGPDVPFGSKCRSSALLSRY